ANTRLNSDEGSGVPTAPPALTIYDVQYTTIVGAGCYDSPENTNLVTLTGIVTAQKTSNSYVIAESSGPWHGVYVWNSTNNPSLGDEITVTGTVSEYNGLTEITALTSYTLNTTGNTVPGPYPTTVEIIGGSGEWGASCNVTTESYEGVLVTLYNVEVSSPTSAYGYWRIKDQGGTLNLGVDDTFYAATVTNGQFIDQITGVILYNYGYYRLNPRNAGDIIFSSCDPSDVTAPDWTVSGDSNLSVTDPQTGGALDLDWDDATDSENPGTVEYAVYRATAPGFTPSSGNRIATGLTVSEYSDSGLTNGVTYYYRIETYNCNANTRLNSDEGSGSPSLASGVKWTFAVFMNGDNNLEGAGIEDFLEMSAVGSDSNINIVVQFDRISGYDSSYDNWTSTKRFYITPGMTPHAANAVQDIGEANMGDGDTLVAFAKWVKDNYPAQHYALVIWDHGEGWRTTEYTKEDDSIFKGASQDETNGWDYLYFTSGTPGVRGEIGLAFEEIYSYYGKKLDIIGFDTCLNQMWENNVESAGTFNYFVGSEMSEWFDGWAYTTFLNELANANGDLTPSELAQAIVDAYAAGEGGQSGDTQSSVDLSYIPALSTAIDEFAVELMYNKSAYGTQIQNARNNTFELDYSNPYYHQVDLYDFCLKLEAQAVPQSLKTKSAAVRTAINNAVLNYYNRTSSIHTYGIGIYYPRSPSNYESDYDSALIAGTNHWDNFIKGETLSDPVILTYNTHSIDDSSGNNDGVADPGETINMPITLRNSGSSTATGISATLSTGSTYITVTQNYSAYPDITSNGTGVSNSNYTFQVAAGTPVGTMITFNINISASGGYSNQDSFQVQIGTLPEIDISGWKLTQMDNGAYFIFPSGTTIPENGYLILGRDSTKSAFESHWGVTLGPNVIYINSGNVCPQINGGETYKLENASNQMIDGITGYTMTSGNTIQRNNPGDDATQSSSWTISSYSSSTPGSGVGTPSNSGVVINEYSDASSYVYEFVELYYDAVSSSCSDTDTTAPDWSGGTVANLTVTPGNQENALDWDDAADSENPTSVKYAVYRDTTTGFTPGAGNRIATGLTASAHNDSGLTNGTTYYYRIQTYNCNANAQFNSDEKSGMPSACNYSDTTAPDWAVSGVSNISVVNTGSNSLGLSWDQATNAENSTVTYDLYRSTYSPVNTGTATLVVDDYSGLSYNDTGLSQGTTYYYKVVAVNCVPLERTGSDEAMGVTSTGGGSCTEVFEDFDAMPNWTAYGNYDYNGFHIENGLADTTYPYGGTGKDVRLRNATGAYLEYGDTDGNGKDGGVGTISFYYRAWDDDPAAVYDVKVNIDNAGWQTIGSQINTTSMIYTLWTHDLNSTSDNILIRVERVSGERLHIDNFSITCPGSGGTCDTDDTSSPDWTVAGDANLIVTNLENGTQLSLDWDNAADAENPDSIRYAVYRSTQTGFSPGLSNRIVTALVSSSYLDTGLSLGTTYFYRLETYNCNANTRYNTDEGSGMPTDPAQPPTLLTAVKGDGQVSLTWSSVTGSDHYRVYYSTLDGGPYSIITSTTATAYTHTGLVNGTPYYYVVRNYDAEKFPDLSVNSNQLTATPNPPGGNDIDISGWKVINRELSGGYTYVIPDNTIIPEGGYVVIGRNSTKTQFETFWSVSLGSDVVYINANNGITINGGEYFELQNAASQNIDGPSAYVLQVNYAGQRTNPGDPAGNTTSWTIISASEASPGSGVGTSSNAGIVINEYSDAIGTGNY
ncbi:MAG TPA: hypothetical protein ENN73_03570, partial [Firmicutes bacterium]|nr:hypothetical protein [Bacillota bacterium]